MTAPWPRIAAACWTWAGPASPCSDPPASPLGVETRLDALSAAGWEFFGLDLTDLRRSDLPVPRLAREVEERGLRCIELEFLTDWWVPGGTRREAAERACDDLLSAAAILECDSIKIGAAFEADPSSTPANLVAGMNRLALRAAGTEVRFALEPMPFSKVGDPAWAQHLLDNVDPVVGLCIDVWHLARSGVPYAELGEIVDPGRILRVELADAHRAPRGALREDSVDHRLPPGRGELDVAAFIAAVEGLGWAGIWGVEVLSTELRSMPLRDGLSAVRSATLEVFDALERPR